MASCLGLLAWTHCTLPFKQFVPGRHTGFALFFDYCKQLKHCASAHTATCVGSVITKQASSARARTCCFGGSGSPPSLGRPDSWPYHLRILGPAVASKFEMWQGDSHADNFGRQRRRHA
jgi:hypothetical protein